jgi:transposase/transposase-like protein
VGAPAGRRLPPRADDRPGLTAQWLRRRYVAQRRSAQEIATETGWSSQYVRDRLRDHGIPLRSRGAAASLPPVDPAALAGWSAQGLSLAQIATRTGYSPSGVRKLLHRAGLPSRAAGPVRSSPDPAELAEVVRRYRDEGRSLKEVGAAFGRGPDWAKARVRAAGLTVRPGGTPRTELDLEQLRRWRLEEGLTIGEIATRAGRSASTVAEALRRAGVTVTPRRAARPPLDPAVLRRLYVEERRPLGQVATVLGASERRVRAAIIAAGIPLRPARRRADLAALPTLSRAQLTKLYLRQRLTTSEIAARYGGSDNWVRTALETHAIDRRTGGARPVLPVDLDAATLTDLYVTRRLDDPAIAAQLGVPTWRVTTRRRELKVTRPPVPPPHPDPPPTPPAAELRRLYLDERLPTAAIGARYGTDPKTAQRWLRAADIAVRPRTAREHRHTLDVTELRELYQHRQWTATEIAAYLDTTSRLVLRTLHDAGVPVRRGGTRPRRRPPEETRLLAALYADPEVSAVLCRHRVPRRPRPGTIATRFPTPVPLTAQLLAALYAETGLSARQIELLTGQPHEQILDALHQAGIPVRRPTGSSPWLTRQRARANRTVSTRSSSAWVPASSTLRRQAPTSVSPVSR